MSATAVVVAALILGPWVAIGIHAVLRGVTEAERDRHRRDRALAALLDRLTHEGYSIGRLRAFRHTRRPSRARGIRA